MNRLITSVVGLFFLLLPNITQAQDQKDWTMLMNESDANFFDIQEAFEAYWKGRPYEKGKGYKQFKRWEAEMEYLVDENGQYDPSRVYRVWNDYLERIGGGNLPQQNSVACASPNSANWSLTGPLNPPGPTGWNNDAIGRIDCFGFHPTNANTYWAGSPSGGLWKTTDNGANWTTSTDAWNMLGVSAIIIDPNNTNIMYVATGSRDSGNTIAASFGVMKSTDGGVSWSPSGLSGVSRISQMLLDPSNSNNLVAATIDGAYYSTDAGGNWTLATGISALSNVYDINYKPGTSSTVYAATSEEFFKSTDGGQSYTAITMPFATGQTRRIAIATTDAQSNYVYIAASNNSNGLYNIYRSTDSGATFSVLAGASAPTTNGNTLGNYLGSQAWYDWVLEVDPTNANVLYMGAVSMCRSSDNGATWAPISSDQSIHVDMHNLQFHPTTNLAYIGCDGGIYRETATGNWDRLHNGLAITQIYRVGLSPNDPNLMMIGNQDNGVMKKDGTNWIGEVIGDGMVTIFDPTNNNIQYASTQNGRVRKSTNGGGNWSVIIDQTITGQSAEWTIPLELHPNDPATLFAGFEDLFKSTDRGETWTNISSGALTTSVEHLRHFAICKSNTDVMYVANRDDIWHTSNGGTTWTLRTDPNSSFIRDITVHPNDPNTLWMTKSFGRVYKSTDAGVNWTEISGTLPSLTVNTIVYQENAADDLLYVGLDVGIYYRDNTMSDWQLYNTNLPNVIIKDLKINYCSGKLLAATFGRGLWESDLYCFDASMACCLPESASITSPSTVLCSVGSSITLTGNLAPTSYGYQWYKDNVLMAGETSQVLSTTLAGDYSLIYTHPTTCESYPSNPYTISDLTPVALPYTADFDNVATVGEWTVNNPDNSFGWATQTGVSCYDVVFSLNNFNYNASGQEDFLNSPFYDLSGVTNATLTFELSYVPYASNFSDGLQVQISTDCGMTSTTIFNETGLTLATNNPPAYQNSSWSPSDCNDWATHTLDLSAYVGNTVSLSFVNVNGYGNPMYLDNIMVTASSCVSPSAPVITSAGTDICMAGTGTPTSMVVDAGIVAPAGYSYQWQMNGVDVAGATGQTFTATAAGSYSVYLTDPTVACNSVVSNAIVMSLINCCVPPSAPVITSAGTDICMAGTGTPTNMVLDAGSAAPTGYSYQWQMNGVDVTGLTSQTLTATSAGNYSVYLTDATNCNSAVSNVITISLINCCTPPSAPVITSAGTDICMAGTGTPTNMVLDAGSAAPTGYSYQWQMNGVEVVGATGQTFTATAAGSYSVYLTDPTVACNSAVSNAIVMSLVNCCVPPSAPVIMSAGTAICIGGTGMPTSMVVDAGVVAPAGYNYQWQMNGVDMVGATSQTFTATAAGSYSVYLTDPTVACNSVVSNAIVMSLVNCCVPPNAPVITSDVSQICMIGTGTPETALLDAGLTAPTGYTYQWQVDGIDLVGANTQTFTTNFAANYTVYLVDNNFTCNTAISNSIAISMIDCTVPCNTPATPVISADFTEICMVGTGNPDQLTLEVDAAAPSGFNYQWQLDGTDIVNETGQSLLINVGGTYGLYLTDGAGCTSATTTIMINAIDCATTAIQVQAKVLLQGVYTGNGSMSTFLNGNTNLITTTQPYDVAPWNYTGTESVASITDLPIDAVDWVLLELRDVTDNTIILSQRAAFLMSNGALAELDGTTGVGFTGVASGSYYLVVRHRNHLDIMSGSTISIPNATPYDFTTTHQQAFGSSVAMPQQAALGDGGFGLFSGDVDGNGVTNISDLNIFFQDQAVINQYSDADLNLDGTVSILDYNQYQNNPSGMTITILRY